MNFQLRSIVAWPVLGALQKLQDLVFAPSHRGEGSLGIGLDRLKTPRGLLLRKGPAFWEERRRLLANAILGPYAAPEHRSRIAPVVTEAETGTGRMFLTWDLGEINATALLSRPGDHERNVGSSRGLVIIHSGHEGDAYDREENLDPYGYARLLVGLGFDVLSLCMPLIGYNNFSDRPRDPDPDPALYLSPHAVFDYWESEGKRDVLSYFLAPVLMAIDWAEETLGHTHFAMAGCSGGGWTTTVAAALDPRISLSIPIPAPLPPHLMDMNEWYPLDWEAKMNPTPVYKLCSFICMFVLSTIGGKGMRRSVHLLHMNEMYPNPSPNNVEGREEELEAYYGRYLPSILAAAQPPRPADLIGSPGGTAALGSPLRLAVSGAREHCGDWHDHAMLETLLLRWHSSHGVNPPHADVFAAGWPLPSDVRRGSCAV